MEIKKKILITGGAGFIGSNLALKLLAQGSEVTVMDNLSPQIHGTDPGSSPLYQSIRDKVRFIKADVTNRDDWNAAIGENEVIVHLAAETGTGQSMYQIDHYVRSNIGGTSLMLDILANQKTNVKKIIVASSRSIYGEGKYFSKELGVVYPGHRVVSNLERGEFEVTYPNAQTPLQLEATDEASKIHPSSIYGITKQSQEQLVLLGAESLGIDAIAFRYQNVYGPGQSLRNPYTGILSIFSTQIKNGLGINIFEDGLESRDFVFIDDVVDATALGILNNEPGSFVFNVGSGIPTTVLTVAQTLMKNYGLEVPLTVTGNFRVGDIRHNYADLTRIKAALGFTPKFTFEEGIARFCNWVNTQAVEKSRYEDSLQEMKMKGLFK